MKFLVLSALLATAFARPNNGYGAPPVLVHGPVQCGPGQVPRGDGSCARPLVTRNLYLYNAPHQQPLVTGPVNYPIPKVHYNFVFVRTADQGQGVRPVIAPAPQQKTLVYLLSKRPSAQQQEVIEVENTPTQPEVFFVQYSDGENAQLPGGIDLQTALSQAAHQGQVIANAGGHGGGAVISGGNAGGTIISGGHAGGGNIISGGYSAPSTGTIISGGSTGGGIISGGGSGGGFVSGGGSGGGFVSGGHSGGGGFVSGGNSGGGGFISGGNTGGHSAGGSFGGFGQPGIINLRGLGDSGSDELHDN